MWIETKLSGSLNSQNLDRVEAKKETLELVYHRVSGSIITERYNSEKELVDAYNEVMKKLDQKYLQG